MLQNLTDKCHGGLLITSLRHHKVSDFILFIYDQCLRWCVVPRMVCGKCSFPPPVVTPEGVSNENTFVLRTFMGTFQLNTLIRGKKHCSA